MRLFYRLRRFLREELESERRDLVFLLQIVIPVTIAVAAGILVFWLNKNLKEEMKPILTTPPTVGALQSSSAGIRINRRGADKEGKIFQEEKGTGHDIQN